MKGQLVVGENCIVILFLLAAVISGGAFIILSRKLSLQFKPEEITFVMM